MRLYDFLESGNGYKVRLLLHQLGHPFERVEIDILQGESRTPEFLERNPNGRIPVLELADGTLLWESNAIQWYLAEGTRFLPDAPIERARVLQWMFFEQYSHEPYVAVPRFWALSGASEAHCDELPGRMQQGRAALGVMESHLATRSFFVGERYTIADIALYAYTHVAPEGGYDLAPYPAVESWLERVRSQPDHVPITRG